MIYLELFLGFLWVGCFSFGGAYAAIPLIRDVVLSYEWMTDEKLTYMIAVSESTPGPIMVNLATYVGNQKGGFLGAAIATLAVITPAFFTILLIMVVLRNFFKGHLVQSVLNVVKPCIIGIIFATGIDILINICINSYGNKASFNFRAIVITAILTAVIFGAKSIFKKKISPIFLIIISAIAGIFIYAF